MSLHQFLLIILATALVSGAAIMGLTRLGESAVITNRDALAKDCQTIISKARGFYKKSIVQDGGGNSFTDLTFASLGMGSGSSYASAHGRFTLTSTAQTVTCLGTGNEQVVDGSDVQVKLVYFANNDSTGYRDNMAGGTLRSAAPVKAMATSTIFPK